MMFIHSVHNVNPVCEGKKMFEFLHEGLHIGDLFSHLNMVNQTNMAVKWTWY